MMTRALAKAFAPKVTVNSVAPGVITFGEPDELSRHLDRKNARLPLGDLLTTIADAVVFFPQRYELLSLARPSPSTAV